MANWQEKVGIILMPLYILLKRKAEVPVETLLGKAVSYTLNQWDKLTAYLGCAELTPDNNMRNCAVP
jgi:hypothetical protein